MRIPWGLRPGGLRRAAPRWREGGNPAGGRRWLPGWLAPDTADSLEPTIYRFILRYSLRDQIYLVVVTLLSFPFLYYSLDLPKVIVNQAIGGKNMPGEILGV